MTKILTKTEFLEILGNSIEDGEIILLTADKVGNISVAKKQNSKKVTFSYAADAFKSADDIRDIAFGQVNVLSFAICKKEYVSERALELLIEANKKNNENVPSLRDFKKGFKYKAFIGYDWITVEYPKTGFSKEQLPTAIINKIVRFIK